MEENVCIMENLGVKYDDVYNLFSNSSEKIDTTNTAK